MKSACFTIVKDEELFLPLIEKYYAHQFDDFYVLDHESVDGSIEKLLPTTKVVRVHHEKAFDHTWLLNTVKNFQQELLKSYDIVCFVEADEFMVHKHKTIKQICEDLYNSPYDFIKPQGYQLLDGGVVWDRVSPILESKKFWSREKQMDKILITKKPMDYAQGFHIAYNESSLNGLIDPDFYMLHLHYFDKGVYFERIEKRNKYKFSLDGYGMYNQHTDMEAHKLDFEKFKELMVPMDSEIPIAF